MGNILISCSKWVTSHQKKGLGWSLGDWSCWKKRRILLRLLFVNQNWVFSHWTHLKNGKSWREKGSIYAWSENCMHVQARFFLLKLDIFQIGHLILTCFHVPCTCTRKHFIPSPLCLPGWGSSSSRQMVVWKFLSLRKQQALGCRKKFLRTSCHCWDAIFTVRVTESGPKSRDHLIPSLEAEKVMLLYCWLEMYTMRKEMKFFINRVNCINHRGVGAIMP